MGLNRFVRAKKFMEMLVGIYGHSINTTNTFLSFSGVGHNGGTVFSSEPGMLAMFGHVAPSYCSSHVALLVKDEASVHLFEQRFQGKRHFHGESDWVSEKREEDD